MMEGEHNVSSLPSDFFPLTHCHTCIAHFCHKTSESMGLAKEQQSYFKSGQSFNSSEKSFDKNKLKNKLL